MPPVRIVQVGDREVQDDSAQMNWIQTLVDRINVRLGDTSKASATEEDDDLPEDFNN